MLTIDCLHWAVRQRRVKREVVPLTDARRCDLRLMLNLWARDVIVWWLVVWWLVVWWLVVWWLVVWWLVVLWLVVWWLVVWWLVVWWLVVWWLVVWWLVVWWSLRWQPFISRLRDTGCETSVVVTCTAWQSHQLVKQLLHRHHIHATHSTTVLENSSVITSNALSMRHVRNCKRSNNSDTGTK